MNGQVGRVHVRVTATRINNSRAWRGPLAARGSLYTLVQDAHKKPRTNYTVLPPPLHTHAHMHSIT